MVRAMNEDDFMQWLREAIEANFEVKRIRTFEDAMVCTYNRGFVVFMEDGTEFQVTVNQSK